jgi:tetratricopeptide (TPR) repeat protein
MNRKARIDTLISMLEKEPGDLFLNYVLGIEYANDLSSVADAESQFKIVLNLDPNYIAAYYQLGKLLESLLRNPEALECYKVGLEKAKEQQNNKAVNEFNEALFNLEES